MNKFIFSILLLCGMAGCQCDISTTKLKKSDCGYTVRSFIYNKHTYLKFGDHIVHDPDCVCLTKKIEKGD